MHIDFLWYMLQNYRIQYNTFFFRQILLSRYKEAFTTRRIMLFNNKDENQNFSYRFAADH